MNPFLCTRPWLVLVFLPILWLHSCQSERDESRKIQAWILDGWVKVDSLNPILLPTDTAVFMCPLTKSAINWQTRNVLNPAAVVRNDSVFLFFRAQDQNGTSRIGLAISTDGLHFKKEAIPVVFPEADTMNVFEWNYKKRLGLKPEPGCTTCLFDGTEDPRIISTDDGRYVMTYTAYDGKTARLCVATSSDLTHWKKEGLAFKDDKYKNMWSKSGAIIGKVQPNGQVVATRVDGTYWMYFGDTDLFIAQSDDLISWKICERAESGEKIRVLSARPGYFDSRLVEPGPYALLRDQGILLIYNASNAANFSDPSLPKFTYAAGQALFNKSKPYQLIDRTPQYFIHPDKTYEKTGEVNEVCFVEGLVFLKQRWFLYYGTADSRIGVAIK